MTINQKRKRLFTSKQQFIKHRAYKKLQSDKPTKKKKHPNKNQNNYKQQTKRNT
jgi:hypothetical protein